MRKFGWKPDIPDQRDHMYFAPAHTLMTLPPSVDLRDDCPPVVDQGELGSCTACAIANAHRYDQMKQNAKDFMPSRLFIYYNERAMEGTVKSDSGAYIRDGMKSISKLGVCSESVWKYDIRKFAKKPPMGLYTEALKHQAISYKRLTPTLPQLKSCLAEGYPFVFGFAVYESFMSDSVAETGQVHMPSLNESMLGGHAVLAVGYDDATQTFIVMNSWSEQWGDFGMFYMPYAYLTNNDLADDFWTVRLVEV